MFAEEQSDVQEFFLYLVEELAKEVESLRPLRGGGADRGRGRVERDRVGRPQGDHPRGHREAEHRQLALRDAAAQGVAQLLEAAAGGAAVLPDALAAHRLQLRRCAAGVRA